MMILALPLLLQLVLLMRFYVLGAAFVVWTSVKPEC